MAVCGAVKRDKDIVSARDWLGPLVWLWRRFRDGTETHECLRLLLAELTLAAIPECEPQVERAKIIR